MGKDQILVYLRMQLPTEECKSHLGNILLVDAGYYNADFALTLYCGVRYQLKKQVLGPGNKKNYSMLCHSSLRNSIRANTWDT